MPENTKTTPLLAIRPGRRQMGIAVLSDSDLRFWGTTRFRREKRLEDLLSAVERRLRRLIRLYHPGLLVAEQPTPSRLRASPWLAAIMDRLNAVALEAGLEFRLCDPGEVRERLCGSERATRQDLAGRVVAVYPHLGRYRQGASRWQEDYWRPMFMAVAVGMAGVQGLSASPSAPRGAGTERVAIQGG
jgi:Holliday junction resolvasome RuvABC endonuclease subunit